VTHAILEAGLNNTVADLEAADDAMLLACLAVAATVVSGTKIVVPDGELLVLHIDHLVDWLDLLPD
jgi:hypothetical protein